MIGAMRSVLSDRTAADIAPSLFEAALPAYTCRNLLARRIFWSRIEAVWKALAAQAEKADVAIDFGCGAGVMLAPLCHCAKKVVAVDRDLRVLELIARRVALPCNVWPCTVEQFQSWVHEAPGSAGIVVALDVLEHVDDLEGSVQMLIQSMNSRSVFVASVPNENRLYRIGRRIAGADFSGQFHRTSWKDVRRCICRWATIEREVNVPLLLKLFRVLVVRRATELI